VFDFQVEERSSITLLVAGMRRDVQALISEGVQLVWDSYKLDPYVQRLAEAIFLFQERVDDLLAVEERIDLEVKAIDTCAYNKATFAEVLSHIQKYVDDLSLHQYSNLLQWVARLDHEVSVVFIYYIKGLHFYCIYDNISVYYSVFVSRVVHAVEVELNRLSELALLYRDLNAHSR